MLRWGSGMAIVFLAATALAGCSGPGPAASTAPNLEFAPMAVTTVPLEPLDARGILSVAWQGSLMAVHTEHEGGMPAYAVRDGATLYTSQVGMGWTRWDLARYVEEQPRGFRYLAWDVPALLDGVATKQAAPERLEAEATFQQHGHAVAASLRVNHTGAHVDEVRITTPADPESPYTLRPLAGAFSFPVQVPASSRPADEVARLDAEARQGHAAILGWIHQYKDQLGSLPQDVSSQGLAVQRLDKPWPTDPYDGQPMRNQLASGEFGWSWCSGQDASFHGYGWDGAPLNEDFGRGCTT